MNLFEYIFPSFVFWLCHLTERIMKHTNKSKIVNIFAKISQIDKWSRKWKCYICALLHMVAWFMSNWHFVFVFFFFTLTHISQTFNTSIYLNLCPYGIIHSILRINVFPILVYYPCTSLCVHCYCSLMLLFALQVSVKIDKCIFKFRTI